MHAEESPHILSQHSVVTAPQPTVVSIPGTLAKDGWQVRLDRDGKVVRLIQVTCRCGEQMVIECEYESAAD